MLYICAQGFRNPILRHPEELQFPNGSTPAEGIREVVRITAGFEAWTQVCSSWYHSEQDSLEIFPYAGKPNKSLRAQFQGKPG